MTCVTDVLISLVSLMYHVTRWDRPETLITKPWLLHESVQGQSNQYSHTSSRQTIAAMCYLEEKSLFLKQHNRLSAIVHAHCIKSKQLHIVNNDKIRSKRTRSQFPFQTLLTITPRIVSMSN